MLRALLLALCLGLAAATHAQISKPAFTQQFLEQLRQKGPGYTFEVKGEMEIHARDAKDREFTLFLDNAYSAYAAEPQAKDEVVQRYVASFLESAQAQDAPVVRENIVPVIKDRPWLEEIARLRERHKAKPGTENVVEDYNEDLVILYAEDSPRNIRYLTQKDLDELGLKRGELRALAVANLRRVVPDIRLRESAHLSMLLGGGDYEASLILLDELWREKIRVRGEIVIAIPARDLLIFTGSASEEGLRQLRLVAARAAREASYRLTEQLFVYRNGKFERFAP
jgi:uncharacterized protein YtpQ (UPF0354 family)